MLGLEMALLLSVAALALAQGERLLLLVADCSFYSLHTHTHKHAQSVQVCNAGGFFSPLHSVERRPEWQLNRRQSRQKCILPAGQSAARGEQQLRLEVVELRGVEFNQGVNRMMAVRRGKMKSFCNRMPNGGCQHQKASGGSKSALHDPIPAKMRLQFFKYPSVGWSAR